jgi:hypothetical protein
MPLSTISLLSVAMRKASSELSEFVMYAAATTSQLVGFSWVGQPDAPGTYPDLLGAVEKSLVTGDPLPVSNENTDRVIYAFPEVNLALRYWHDVSHVMRGLDFTAPKELQLAQLQLRALEQAGIESGSLTWRLLQADLVGQVFLSAIGGRFPVDQVTFVERALTIGIEAAVLAELGEEVTAHRLALPPQSAA